MPGARGPLKVVGPLKSVAQAQTGTAATRVSPLAPNKPKAVAEDEELSQLWDEIVPELDKAGLLCTADVMSVEMTLRHFRAARAASDELAEGGVTMLNDEENTRYGTKKNPAEVVFRLESAAFMEYAKQLGMTFMARARTAAPEGTEGGEANPFAATGS